MLEIAYAAGLFDGEGTVGVYGQRGWKKLHYCAAKLALSGNYKPVIDELSETFSYGSVLKVKRQSLQRTPSRDYNPKLCKQQWRWNVSNKKDIKDFLTKIRPYLREKAKQADIVLRFINGELTGPEASDLCKEAKDFEFNGKELFVEPHLKGSDNPIAKLDEDMVSHIKSRLSNGESQNVIAKEVGVHRSTIYKIDHGISWSHVA